MGKTQHNKLREAKVSKKDEFYTQLEDIERELKHYKHHFENKVVYCNCDDPRVSNFFHFFSYNFEKTNDSAISLAFDTKPDTIIFFNVLSFIIDNDDNDDDLYNLFLKTVNDETNDIDINSIITSNKLIIFELNNIEINNLISNKQQRY